MVRNKRPVKVSLQPAYLPLVPGREKKSNVRLSSICGSKFKIPERIWKMENLRGPDTLGVNSGSNDDADSDDDNDDGFVVVVIITVVTLVFQINVYRRKEKLISLVAKR